MKLPRMFPGTDCIHTIPGNTTYRCLEDGCKIVDEIPGCNLDQKVLTSIFDTDISQLCNVAQRKMLKTISFSSYILLWLPYKNLVQPSIRMNVDLLRGQEAGRWGSCG